MVKKKKSPSFPTKEKILEFIRSSPHPPSKREIARAFNIRGDSRILLKQILREIESDGDLGVKKKERRFEHDGHLPHSIVVELATITPDGEMIAKSLDERVKSDHKIYLARENQLVHQLSIGEQALVKLTAISDTESEGYVLRLIEAPRDKVLGIYHQGKNGETYLKPVEKKDRHLYPIARSKVTPQIGELVYARLLPQRRRMEVPAVEIIEILGDTTHPKSVSLIAIYSHGIPNEFPAEAKQQAIAAKPALLGDREDLRQTPLITIDGEDARDFDDAVWAEPDQDPNNPGGWHLIVAIADVAHYVTPGSPLDQEAYHRGNSVYFADRVVPMLPEELSNDLCSLRPDEDRASMAVHIWIDAAGQKLRHRFTRALIRSHARTTYKQIESLIRHPDPSNPLSPMVTPLVGAYHSLRSARQQRGTLELDVAEFQIKLRQDGTVEDILPRARWDSHALIEEFMVLANVCAAETLEDKKLPCMYRIHDEPAQDRLFATREFLQTLGLNLAMGNRATPKAFTQILNKVKDSPYEKLVHQVILRTQSQARYDPANIGHFGLALTHYAHFTSPIRRYADLLVHRALIKAFKFGDDSLTPDEMERFQEMADHISLTERRAAAAERETVDRYMASYMQDKVGMVMPAHINGVSRFGMFITLDGMGADGFIPMRSLDDDFYRHDEKRHALIGRHRQNRYQLGDPILARLVEATPVSGGLRFEPVRGEEDEDGGRRPFKNRSHRQNRQNRDQDRRHNGNRDGKYKGKRKAKGKGTAQHGAHHNGRDDGHDKGRDNRDDRAPGAGNHPPRKGKKSFSKSGPKTGPKGPPSGGKSGPPSAKRRGKKPKKR